MLKVLGTMIITAGIGLTSACSMDGGARGERASESSAAGGGTTARCEGLSGQALERCRAQGAGSGGSTSSGSTGSGTGSSGSRY